MDIKVGSKWESNILKHVVKVVYATNKIVCFEFEYSNDDDFLGKDIFLEEFHPYVKKYEWTKLDNVEFERESGHTDGVYCGDALKQYELLYNYHKYHNEFDNVEFNDYEEVCFIDNEGAVFDDRDYIDCDILTPIFSTREHAKMFMNLAKENDCL